MTLLTEILDRCPICSKTDLRRLLEAPDHESHTGIYGIDECTACGVAFTNPRPLESELPKLYESRSTADFPRMHGFVSKLRDRAIDQYLASQLADFSGSGTADFRALDFGCGDGALASGLVRFCKARGSSVRVLAVDFHALAPHLLVDVGPEISYVTNADWSTQTGSHDAIFLRHVLEHHPHPLRLLGELAAALRPGGRLFIEVPNRRSVWARLFGSAYSGYYLPRHLFHFDAVSLRGAIDRSGMTCVAVSLAHTPLVGRSLGYWSGRDIGNTGLLGLATYPLQVSADVVARQSSTLRAVAARHA